MSKKRSKVHPKYKTRYRVRNWAEYDRALVRRGDLTIWFDEAAISAWELGPAGARGRPRVYSALAIETALTLRLVYGLPWRQTEGLLHSLVRLLGLRLRTPDHTTLSRRARASRIRLAPQNRSGPDLPKAGPATGASSRCKTLACTVTCTSSHSPAGANPPRARPHDAERATDPAATSPSDR